MKVMALTVIGGLPACVVLSMDHPNPNHENHINIAYRYWQEKTPVHDWYAILLVFDTTMSVYTPSDFQRTFHR